MGKDTMEKVSIIIPTFNRKNDLRGCLESIYRQDYTDFEVLIIDNGSTDGTREMVLSEYPKVRLFINKKNLYACKTRNLGIAKSSGSYIWFLDSDSIITKDDCLSIMMKLIKSDETIGSIGGTVYLFDDQSTRIGVPYKNRFNMFDDWNRERFQLIECDFLPSSNLLMEKELLLRIGGFTEIYHVYWEDYDLGLKVIKAGLKNIADRRTIVLHRFKPGLRNFKKTYLHYRNVVFFIFLNYPFKNWSEVIIDIIFKSEIKHTLMMIKRPRDRLIVWGGFLLGFASLIFSLIPMVMRVKYGKKNYITQYVNQRGS